MIGGYILAKSSKLLREHLHQPTGTQSHLCACIPLTPHWSLTPEFPSVSRIRGLHYLNLLRCSEIGLLPKAVKKNGLYSCSLLAMMQCLLFREWTDRLYSALLISSSLPSKSLHVVRTRMDYYLGKFTNPLPLLHCYLYLTWVRQTADFTYWRQILPWIVSTYF